MASQESNSESRQKLIGNLYIIGGVVGAILLGALVIGGIYLLSSRFSLEVQVIRDLFVIGLTLLMCIFGITLIILVVMVIRLVNTLEFEIKPILEKTNQLVGTAQGTTDFVSKNVVEPTIKAKGYIAGAKAGAKALISDPKKNLPK